MRLERWSPEDFQAYLDSAVITPPPGVEVRRGARGLGLFATQSFGAGDEIYRAIECHIPDDGCAYRAHVRVDGHEEEIAITSMHSVRYLDGRSVDLPGCFMNHACDPSSVSIDVMDDDNESAMGYIQVATRDLAPGDEITCDYVLFHWDGDGHQFSCGCGAPGCYGFVAGFMHLPAEVQQRLADRTYSESQRMWQLTRP